MNRREILTGLGVVATNGLVAGSDSTVSQVNPTGLKEMGWVFICENCSIVFKNGLNYTPEVKLFGHLSTWKPNMNAFEMTKMYGEFYNVRYGSYPFYSKPIKSVI